MKNKKVICLVLCGVIFIALGVIGVWRSHTVPTVTRCLLIGCDRFVSMPGTEPASANNVETMAALLTDFLPEDTAEDTLIIRQVNGPGTVAGFEQLVADAFRRSNEADTCLVYLSTHGKLIQNSEFRIQNDESETRGTGYEMALLLSDGAEEEYLTPEKLRETMDKLPGKKILILDACHSGAVIGKGWDEGNPFEGSDCRVLVSSGAMEESWFWNTETDGYTGTGYFTAAMDNALRASDPEQIASDGKGNVSLKGLTARLREIHGASTVYCWPEEDQETLFYLPADRKTGSHLQGIAFGEAERDGDAVVLPIRYKAGEAVRVMYQLIPGRNGTWDFEHAVRLPDREKTGLIRGLVSPGEKERKIRLTVKSLGEDGKALMQIITFSGDGLTPAAEAGHVISIGDEK